MDRVTSLRARLDQARFHRQRFLTTALPTKEDDAFVAELLAVEDAIEEEIARELEQQTKTPSQ